MSRGLRMVQMALHHPVEEHVFTDSDEEYISDTSHSDYVPSNIDSSNESIDSSNENSGLHNYQPIPNRVLSMNLSQDQQNKYLSGSESTTTSLNQNCMPHNSNQIHNIIESPVYSSEIHSTECCTNGNTSLNQNCMPHNSNQIHNRIESPVCSSEIQSTECCTNENNQSPVNVSGGQLVKRIRRQHTCPFCNLDLGNFARHLERNHSDEASVQEFLCLDKKSQKRKKIIDKLRREGDFCTSTVIPVMRQNKAPNEFIVCKFCRGYYSQKSLRRHAKHCYFNPEPNKRFNAQIEGQTMMAGPFGPNDILRVSGILNMLRADDTSMVVKKDLIICEVGRRYIRRHKEKHLLNVAKRNMRRLGRLLIAARQIEKNESCKLIDILSPKKFKLLVKATQAVSGYDEKNRSFSSPSLALQMGTIIKSAVNAAHSLEIQKQYSSPNLLEQLKALLTLIETDWAHEISSEAGTNLAINKFNKPTLIPMAEDIAKFEEYLKNLIMQSKTALLANSKNFKAYRVLLESIFCNILIFNKRRVGELQRITLASYVANYDKPVLSTDFEKILSESEKILFHSLKRIVIRGKRGRGVPVLFERDIVQSIEFLISARRNFELADNPYLFGLPGTENPIAGSSVMRKHAKIALKDANKAALLTSTKLRKHLATMVQILKMDRNELEQLATFMGHTAKTHAEFYRLPDDIYQTAKVSKLLMLAKSSSIEQYKGKPLSEIEIDDNLVEVDSEDDDIHLDTEDAPEDIQHELSMNSSTVVGNNSLAPGVEHKKKNAKQNKPKRTLVPWTKEQHKLTEQFFKTHIQKKIAPKKNEVLSLIAKHPNVFCNKSWTVIKVYVQNKYSKK